MPKLNIDWTPIPEKPLKSGDLVALATNGFIKALQDDIDKQFIGQVVNVSGGNRATVSMDHLYDFPINLEPVPINELRPDNPDKVDRYTWYETGMKVIRPETHVMLSTASDCGGCGLPPKVEEKIFDWNTKDLNVEDEL